MKFGEAIEIARLGRAVAREGWNGKGMWVTVSPGNLVDPSQLWGAANRHYANNRPHGVLTRILPYTTMRTAAGDIQVGWVASQTDMLADDWMEVPAT